MHRDSIKVEIDNRSYSPKFDLVKPSHIPSIKFQSAQEINQNIPLEPVPCKKSLVKNKIKKKKALISLFEK